MSPQGRPDGEQAPERARAQGSPAAIDAPAGTAAHDDPIAALVAGTWPDPDGTGTLGVPIASIVIEPSLAGSEGDLVRAIGLGGHLAVVFDPATGAALGDRVARALAGRANVQRVCLPADVHADDATAERLRRATAAADALVAVGSGTINDLCKHAAAQDAKPYCVFATAPSMNGYASGNAAITVHGHKHTLAARAPHGVFMDLAVLAAAPPRLVRAGIGDSLCRATAQVDWRLAHEIHGTPYRRAPFDLLAADEAAWRDAPDALLRGDADAMRALARTLVLSGLGMTICGGSHPASQGEHLVSHYIDMQAPPGRGTYLHGEQVAVATLAMARLQERMLADGPPVMRASGESPATFAQRFGAELGASCWTAFAGKALSAAVADALTARLAQGWSALVATLAPASLPAAKVAQVLAAAGAPRSARDIGVSPAFLARAVHEARFLRDRYTFLDLAGDAGLLDRALAE